MPQSKQQSVNRVYNRVFVNSNVINGESVNWKNDWKMFSGISYASVVKVKINQNPAIVKQSRSLNVRAKNKSHKNSVTSNPKNQSHNSGIACLTKHSDVESNFRVKVKGNPRQFVTPSSHDSIELHNRFNILSNTDQSDLHMENHSENINFGVRKVNKH